MTLPKIPDINLPVFTAEQASKILFVNRSTLLGMVNRYIGGLQFVGIVPVKPGATRRFSMLQLGVLSVVKIANTANAGLDAMLSLDLIAAHIVTIYETLMQQCSWEVESSPDATPRPYIPEPSPPAYLVGRQSFGEGWGFGVQQFPTDAGAKALCDLGGFPLPVLLIALDATLRKTWVRAIWLNNGFDLGEGAN